MYCFKALYFCFTIFLWANNSIVKTQSCPSNIDFELGTFDHWTCYTGYVSAVGTQNVMTLFPSNGPDYNRHTMYPSSAIASEDPYGGFPINCPNGSGYSIKLGNDRGGGESQVLHMNLPFRLIKMLIHLFIIMPLFSRIRIIRRMNNQEWKFKLQTSLTVQLSVAPRLLFGRMALPCLALNYHKLL